jgi:chromosome segregation ATPase
MRKKVSLIIMVLTILIVANLSLNANAQPVVNDLQNQIDAVNSQIQGLQAAIKNLEGQLQEKQKEIKLSEDKKDDIQQELNALQQNTDKSLSPEEDKSVDKDTQQKSPVFTKRGGQQAKVQQLTQELQQTQGQIEQKQKERQQLKLKLQQLQQQEQQIQGPPPRLRH